MANRSSFLRSISLLLVVALCFGAIGAVQAVPHSPAVTGSHSAEDTARALYSHADISHPVTPMVKGERPARIAAPGEIAPVLVKAGSRAIGNIPNRTTLISALRDRLSQVGSRGSPLFSGSGTVVYMDIEGGFWGIVADDGSHYLPGNLPASCMVNGLRVKFYGREGAPLPNIRMWGTPLRLISVSPIGVEIRANGTVEYMEFEGGFYGIVTAGGEHYLPLNLPDEYKRDGLEVTFVARTAPDINTIYMWGIPVTIVSMSGVSNNTQSESSSLIGAWTLASLARESGMTPVIPGTEITAQFSAGGVVSGTSGCNLYSASYETTGQSLEIGIARCTLMYCSSSPGGVMEQESAYLGLLNDVASWKVNGGELVLSDASGRDILLFSAGTADSSGNEEPMVEFWRTGGFAGMDDRLVIYPEGSASLTRKDYTVGFSLTEEELETLVALLEGSGFMNLAPQYQAPPGSADLFIYQICWQEKKVLAEDTVIPSALQPLIDELTRLVVENGPDDVMLPLAL